MKKLIFGLIFLSSCTLVTDRNRERQLQTDIVAGITQEAPKLSQCAQDNNVFDLFKLDRLNMTLFLSINSDGQIGKFKLDKRKYPESFSECVYKVVNQVKFPKIKSHEVIELEQPFIFSKK